VEASYGEAVDYDNARPGHRPSAGPRIEFKLGRGLSAEIAHTYEYFTECRDELYTANIWRLKTVYQFNRRTFVRGVAQRSRYDLNAGLYASDVQSESTQLSTQLPLSYKVNPQTVFFLGYSDGHSGDGKTPLTQSGRTFFAKTGHALLL
jgi:hypothetical protein